MRPLVDFISYPLKDPHTRKSRGHAKNLFQKKDNIKILSIVYFIPETFNIDLKNEMENLRRNANGEIEKAFKNIVSYHAPIKTQMLRHNSSPFMTKGLTKEVMKTIQLKNDLNKNRNHAIWCNYKSH